MKKFAVISLIALLVFTLAGCVGQASMASKDISWDPTTEPDFDGMHWGIGPVDVRERLGGEKLTKLDSGDYYVNNVEFGEIDCYKVYSFNNKDQLYDVTVNFPNALDSIVPKLNQYLMELYGNPETSELDTGSIKGYTYVFRNERSIITLSHSRSATNDIVYIISEYASQSAGT